MSDQWSYSDGELEEYFENPERRSSDDSSPTNDNPAEKPKQASSGAGGSASEDGPLWVGWAGRWIENPRLAQAVSVLGVIAGIGLAGILLLVSIFASLRGDIPSTQRLENPSVDLATIAYTSDGEELARYARQNRSWLPYDSIGTNVINALVATEDHRFHRHWGVDLQGVAAAAFSSLTGNLRGASTISQQLARNLYDEEVGREVSITRKVREMITAVELEQRYTKTEIIEMYLNTVSFGFNAYGIEAAARTYYGKASNELAVPEAATLVGLLAATTYYNPVRNPGNALQRRNTVMGQMARNGYISASDLETYRDEPVGAQYYSAELYASLAPYFAEHVRLELQRLTRDPEHPLSAYDMYGEGLRVYTTIDSRVQQEAQNAVDEQMSRLQAVVDYEWSNERTRLLSREFEPYLELTPGEDYEPFSRFWSTNTNLVNEYIRGTDHYRTLVNEGREDMEAVEHLRANETFIDSLRTLRTRLETGLVAMDPRTGQVRAWVGGREFRDDRYDKVGIAKRQPGSTFKPFTYVTAIDNGYSPYDTFVDSTFVYQDVGADTTWSPTNFSGSSGQELTMTQALARSLNTITARVALELGPQEIVRYAHRMGIRSELDAVPAISLGTSDVTLLELVNAYSTLANGGLHYEPQTIARVEDRYGNVLWESRSAPQEALSERSAYTVVDMMRGVIDYGTGQRIRTQFGLGDYDLAGKTGTTQRSADGWFIMMHPDLVMGSWVGFNDSRITFRTSTWGQGGRNALFVVGDFARRVANLGEEEGEESSLFSRNAQFPFEDYAPMGQEEEEEDGAGLGW